MSPVSVSDRVLILFYRKDILTIKQLAEIQTVQLGALWGEAWIDSNIIPALSVNNIWYEIIGKQNG